VTIEAQLSYHRGLFGALFDWAGTQRRITDFTGESGPEGLLALDQMGHFGPHGCDLVADRIVGSRRFAELGSGFGGALRYLTDRLAGRDAPVDQAYGVELVPEHCAVSRTISAGQGRSVITEICASAEDVPLPDGCLDAVVVTGSMPHFPRPDLVLREAARLLRPGGRLVCTEEVSLTANGTGPSAAFRDLHPAGVFYTTPVADRLDQLREAGFTAEVTGLTSWAIELLDARLKALRLFRGSAERVLGRDEVDRVVRTLDTARAEFRAGRLRPALVSGIRPDAATTGH
jgi:SAM-dependent methyltransferase